MAVQAKWSQTCTAKMPKIITPLSDVDCRSLRHKPGGRAANRLRDGGGLLLEVLPAGRKVWRLEYRYAGKRNVATHPDDYPVTTLAAARKWRTELQSLLTEGVDPNQHTRAQAQARQAAALATFEAAAEEWRAHKASGWSEGQQRKVEGILRRTLLPWLGRRPVASVTPQELLHCLQRAEKEGLHETAHKAREYASAIFRRSILLGLRNDDPAAALKGALQPKKAKNYAHLTDPAEIGGLLRAIDGFRGMPEVHAALKLLPLVFLRPGKELSGGRWDEIDFDARIWSLPADRMKSKLPHVVPLSEQAVAILRELEPLTAHSPSGLLFPGRDRRKPISENTLNASLRRLGYTKEQQCAHGFRHIASTRLHELGWDTRYIEKQMSHGDRNLIRATYNKAEYLQERTEMMQAWADHLDGLREGRFDKVRPIKSATK